MGAGKEHVHCSPLASPCRLAVQECPPSPAARPGTVQRTGRAVCSKAHALTGSSVLALGRRNTNAEVRVRVLARRSTGGSAHGLTCGGMHDSARGCGCGTGGGGRCSGASTSLQTSPQLRTTRLMSKAQKTSPSQTQTSRETSSTSTARTISECAHFCGVEAAPDASIMPAMQAPHATAQTTCVCPATIG